MKLYAWAPEGDIAPGWVELTQCPDCAALVETGNAADHARWHEEAG